MRPAASVSIDLDELWAYRRSFGLPHEDGASLLPTALPRFMHFMQRHGLKGTAFVVGRDALRAEVQPLLRELSIKGHELGNHSFDHAGDIEAWPISRQQEDLQRAHEAIVAAAGAGAAPLGFRAPSFRVSPTLLSAVQMMGYAYDSSSFPSRLGALSRRWQQRRARSLGQKIELPADAHGHAARALPLVPHHWSLSSSPDRALVEVPITTLPGLRVPLHGTYLQHLADFSPALARTYARAAMAWCATAKVAPHLLLHATDFIGADDGLPCGFLPGMRRPWRDKVALLDVAITAMKARFTPMPLIDCVRQLPPDLKTLVPEARP